MEDLALAFLAVYGALAFVFRVVLQLIRTGSTGVKGVRGGVLEWAAGALLVGGIALSVVGVLHDDAGRVGALDGHGAHAAGAFLCTAGIVMTFGSQFAMGDAWRIGVDDSERTKLVTDGPFRLVRNPIYSGMVPFFAGIALIVPNLATIAAPLLVLAGLEIQTRVVEEPYLVRTHGEEYERYAARVGRFFPGVGRR